MTDVDHLATAAPVAEDICAKLGPEDAIAVALFIVALVGAKTGVGIDKLDKAFSMTAAMVRRGAS